MGHKVFVSFKTEDKWYKEQVQNDLNIDMIDKSLDTPIESDDEDYIMRKIREDYLSDSTVTIFIIGQHSSEDEGKDEQKFIKRELQASLYNGDDNTRNGILGIVLPTMDEKIYRGSSRCNTCGNSHNIVKIDDSTTIKEFSYNYYIPHDKCAWSEDDRYCILVNWEDFKNDAVFYINQAFDKRDKPIADKVTVYPK